MDVEFLPPAAEDVLAAVQTLRHHEGIGRMDLDFPGDAEVGAGGAEVAVVAVLGMYSCPILCPVAQIDAEAAPVDTNVLISHLALLQAAVRQARDLPPSTRPLFLVPQIVLAELDGLKSSSRTTERVGNGSDRGSSTRSSISVLARTAISWLLDTISSPTSSRVLRGQRRGESFHGNAGGQPLLGENNDTLVLDAALWRRAHSRTARVALITEDRNLRLRATVEGVESFAIDWQDDATRLLERLVSGPTCEPAFPAKGLPRRESRHAPPPAPEEWRLKSPPSSRDPPRSLSATSANRSSPQPRARPVPPRARSAPSPTPRSGGSGVQRSFEEPPLYAESPPPPLVAVEAVVDVYYNLALLVSHFVALPIYRHIHEHLEQRRASDRHIWMSELGDWRNWHPETCIERARRWWSDGDVESLCRSGLELAYGAEATRSASSGSRNETAREPSDLRPSKSPTLPPSRGSRWADPRSEGRDGHIERSPRRTDYLQAPTRGSEAARRIPRVADVQRDLVLMQDFLGTDPAKIGAWTPLRWEVLLETTGLFLVAVLGGTFRADVRGEVAGILQQWVADLRVCGVAPVNVEL